MPGAIVPTGFAASDPVPGAVLEINFAQGEAAGDSGELPVLLIGNKLSAGSGAVETLYGPTTPVQVQTEDQVIAVFGAGSELHRMFRRFVAVNRTTPLYFIAATESAGAKAAITVVLANNATGNGNLRCYVGDEFVDVAITSGDTPTAIGDALEDAINAVTHWPVTAANVTGTVTITAKQNGPRGNEIRVQSVITSGIGTTATQGAGAPLSGGATADSFANVLAAILAQRFYRIVCPDMGATLLGAVVTQVNTQALPVTGIRQRVFAGSVDSLANTITVATGRNAARCAIVWAKDADWTSAELATNAAAVAALYETKPNPRCNFAGFGNDAATQAAWTFPAPRKTASHPTRTDIKSALNNGISPIGVNPSGTTYLVDLITTRSLSGAVADYRIRDFHKVTICDYFGDDLLAKLVLQFSGRKLKNDAPQGSPPPGSDVVTPLLVRGAINRLINDYDVNDLLQDVLRIKADMVVQRETNPTTRMGIRIPLRPVDVAKQFAAIIDQVA